MEVVQIPYNEGVRLPGERASKLGHLEVLKSELVRDLIKQFEASNLETSDSSVIWEPMPNDAKPLSIIFGVDGSWQTVTSELPPYRELAFIKTALIRLDQKALSDIDREFPHPFELRDLMSNSAIYHATVLPMKNISVPGLNVYDTVRKTIYDSVKDASLNSEIMETLKWISYEKWSGDKKSLPVFECPHCETTEATLEYDEEVGECPKCHKEILLTDMLGFHMDMSPDSVPITVVGSYMAIHETLMLFTGIRYYWEHNKEILRHCLFVKDGPLSIRAQYSKLVNPIRRFLEYARKTGNEIHMIGQEKSGKFWDHLELIHKGAPERSLYIPGDKYIKSEVQSRPNTGAPYGRDTNYGAKVFLNLSDYHHSVLNIPTGMHKTNPSIKDLMGADKIFATIPTILSSKYEGALLPVELANGIASLSTYPSAQILKLFSISNDAL